MSVPEKVLIFAPFNFAPSFLGLNLEFLQKEIDQGNEVTYMTCDRSFSSCGFNAFGLKYMCTICMKRFEAAQGLINGKFRTLRLADILNPSDTGYAARHMETKSELKKTDVVENFEVGESVYSTLISKTKEKSLSDPAELKIMKKVANQSLMIYNSLKRFIDEQQITCVILFNGRWDYYRAALSAARAKKVRIQVIENLRPGGFYETFGDALPHNRKKKNELIDQHWNAEPDIGLKHKIAGDFFSSKRNGAAVLGKSYTQEQKRGHLPDYIDPAKKLIVIYNSSDFEYEAVGKEYSNPFFPDQASSILFVSSLVSKRADYQLVVRMHPNLKGLKRDFLKPIYHLTGRYPNVFVITPEDEVDSYALMDSAFKVITYVSFMGIEASYWGKPVIILNHSLYSDADIAVVASFRK